ncbi:transglycosylase domain-containing protein [Gracilibacillus kekensis]|uniref:Penicillin-binding protein 1A n=1 Tax=Gracilibacillus kekensis TaxID=1027249 RepID=A0A1M7IHU1_9BACI|nr:PBP1A family penicillin-binding protein [Gracilibacillus kekensis]SHM40301.1 penicillin-binding protein 1A [Gracilibacillus kekensis]
MKHKSKTGNQKGFLKLLLALFLFPLSFVIIAGITGFALIEDTPPLTEKQLKNAKTSIIYDMNGNKIANISGAEHRLPVDIKDVPMIVQNAFIAIEDARFRDHDGIDIKRIAGAAIANVKEGWGAEGGSTITQQVVKNAYLSPEKTLKRKAQEAYLALQMEENYSKDEILEMYLNKIYFGNGAYGIGAASEVYFNKKVSDLSVEEAALLAGLPQRPSGYDPYAHPELAIDRRDIVLASMEKNNFISTEEKKEAQATELDNILHQSKNKQQYQYFIDHVVEELKTKGIKEDEIYSGGLKIYTTLDPNAQSNTEKMMTGTDIIPFPNDNFKSGVVLLDTKTGAIRAIGGNRNPGEQEIKKGFNFATDIKRQPGSTIKPILDYGPLIEYQKKSTYYQIKDEELKIGDKTFKNYDDSFRGMVSMREALVKSYNIPAIKAFLELEKDQAKEFASNLGLNLEHAYPSYAIGGFGDEDGVSPLNMAGAYAAFGNQGEYHEPYSVTKVEYPTGEIMEYQSEGKQAMSDYTAYMITDMLSDVVQHGTGTLANIEGLPLAGKTGTTNAPEGIENGSTDSWFVGYTTEYTAAVWTGYETTSQEQYITKEDARISRLLFKEIMTAVSKDVDTESFIQPSTVKKVDIDKRNGKKASAHTPSYSRITELFVEGSTLPTKYIPAKKKVNNTSQKNKEKEKKQEEDKKKEVDDKKNEEKNKKEKKKKQEKEKNKEKKEANNTPVSNKKEKEQTTDGNNTEEQDDQEKKPDNDEISTKPDEKEEVDQETDTESTDNNTENKEDEEVDKQDDDSEKNSSSTTDSVNNDTKVEEENNIQNN